MASNEGDNNHHDDAALYKAVAAGESADEVRRLIEPLSAVRRAAALDHSAALGEENKTETPLGAARRLCRGDLIGVLVESGADVSSAFRSGATPLAVCAAYGQVESVRALLRAGHDANERLSLASPDGDFFCMAVHVCVRPHVLLKENLFYTLLPPQLACLKVLVCEGGADVDAKDGENETALCWAGNAHREHRGAAVKLLLELGADVNAGMGSDNPFFNCIRCRSHDCARILLDNGARVDGIFDEEGRSPLGLAAEWQETSNVRFLLEEAHVPVDERNPLTDATPLLAVFADPCSLDTEIATMLLDAGADVNAADRAGRTPLLCCAGTVETDLAQLMLDRGASADVIESTNGFTPLTRHAFLWSDHPRVLGFGDVFRLVEELARRSSPATRRLVDRDGCSAVDYLARCLEDAAAGEIEEHDEEGEEDGPQRLEDLIADLLASGAPVLPRNASLVLPLALSRGLPLTTVAEAELAARRSEARRWRAHDDLVTLALEEADLRAVEARVREMERRVRELEEEEGEEEEAATATSSGGEEDGDDDDKETALATTATEEEEEK